MKRSVGQDCRAVHDAHRIVLHAILMSLTSESKIQGLIKWLETNAFWNSELLEVAKSRLGGYGVFWKLKLETDPDNDTLLLRIPKSAILSPKNSFLYSTLVDYEPTESSIDFTQGMHSIVITYIYEQAMGRDSPWFVYLDSFDLEENAASLPICLWSDDEKAALFNTECDLLNMLDGAEMVVFYLECIAFGRSIETLVKIPDVLSFDAPDLSTVIGSVEFEGKLSSFGRMIQAVISRAFTVDKFHGLSLVPGADLFNHLSPIFDGEDVVVRENVHFVCDDDDSLCGICGEIGCDHLQYQSDEDMTDGISDEEVEEGEQEDSDNEIGEVVESDLEIALEDLLETDINLESSDNEESGADSEEGEEEEENDEEGTEDLKNEPEMTEITFKDIEEIEAADSDDDTDEDAEELSTLSLSEDEESNSHNDADEGHKNDLALELADGSKCCDIVLASLPSQDFQYELFNTYGNDLANPYLLQRYGFACKGNVNVSCLLSVPMFAYLKKLKTNAKIKKQLDYKLDWYEEVGFELLNDILAGQDKGHHQHEEDDTPREGHESCGDDCCSDEQAGEVPESWQLSPKVQNDGMPTKQTIVLVRLIKMPFTVFYHKLIKCTSERKLEKRISRMFLEREMDVSELKVIRQWVQERLGRYKKFAVKGARRESIELIIKEEKEVLGRALEVLSS